MIDLNEIRKVIKFISEYQLKSRLKLYSNHEPTNWNDWLTEPSKEYFDFGSEPVKFNEVEYVEINCLVNKKTGRLVPNQLLDKGNVIEEHLINNAILFSELENGIFRIKL